METSNENLSDTKIAWAAGLFDGEGTIGFYKFVSRKTGRISYQKYLGISIGDVRMLLEASRILSLVAGRDLPIALDERHDKLHPHTYYKLFIRKTADIVKLLDAMLPYLVGKRPQAEVMLRLIAGHRMYTRYRDDQVALVEALKILKRSGFANPVPSSEGQTSEKCVETIRGAHSTTPSVMR